MLDRLEAAGQVVLRYAPGENPNGSLDDIAGVINEQGNVFGLMPHPEHAVDPLTGSSRRARAVRVAARRRSLAARPHDAASRRAGSARSRSA